MAMIDKHTGSTVRQHTP